MKLGENVLIIRARERMFLRREKADKPVQRADEYIFLAMRDGQSDGQLNALVAEREGLSELMADLRLAQLVLEFSDYIAPADKQAIEI